MNKKFVITLILGFVFLLGASSCKSGRKNKKCNCPTWDHIQVDNNIQADY